MALLKEHGLSGSVAATVWAVGRRLVARTRRRGVEHADTLGMLDGVPVGPTIVGTSIGTDLSSHLDRLRVGLTYVQVHTHPRSTAFSHYDLSLLTDNRVIRTMVALGIDNCWHVLSKPDELHVANAHVVMDAFLDELRRAAADVPPNERPHVATELVSARFGLRYDRRRGESGARSTS